MAGTGNINLQFEDDEEGYANVEVDVRVSDPTPKKTPNFDIERIRFQLLENERHKHILPETVVDQQEHISESLVQVLEADFKPTAPYEEERAEKETPVVEFYEVEEQSLRKENSKVRHELRLDVQSSEEAYEEVKVPGFVSPVNELNDPFEQQHDISDFDRIRTMSDTAFEDQ